MAKPRFLPHTVRRALTEEEIELFRHTVSDVAPLATEARHNLQRKPARKIIPPHVLPDEPDFPMHGLSAPEWLDVDSLEGLINYRQQGVSQRLLAELRRGNWSIGAEIDLHGITRDEARLVLHAFVVEAGQRGIRCIRIIHGKGYRSPNGQSILKHQVRHWLTQLPHVLAYCETKAAEGGSGAVKVLLKRAI